LTDGQLLERFATGRGEVAELAFAALVERHGAMVLRVCGAELANRHDAQDAFQATFLVLVEKSRSLWVKDSLGPWLHQVAVRTAMCARADEARRKRLEQQAAVSTRRLERSNASSIDLLQEKVLHEEINRLPERYRVPIVLCDLEGGSCEEAARQMGRPLGTVKCWRARGREQLRARLIRRGVTPVLASVTGLSAASIRAALPKALAESIVRAAICRVGGQVHVAGVVSARLLALTEGVLRMMFLTKVKIAGMALVAAGLIATGASVWARQNTGARVEPPATQRTEHKDAEKSQVVARVNGTPITRDELVERCLAKYGAKELETLINLAVVRDAAQRRGITVTENEVESEIRATAGKLGLSVEDFFTTVVQKRRGITNEEFEDDVRSSLVLKKLGARPSLEDFNALKLGANIEVYFRQPATSSAVETPKPTRSQEQRLSDVERKLEQILKALEDSTRRG
jgi:RNA polymerase sigma factor (sigma-70 family)